MKKIILTVFLALIVGLTSNALAQVQFGVKGGVNSSSLSGFDKLFKEEIHNADVDSKQKIGFNVGIFVQVDIPLTDFFVQPELLFSNQGSKVKTEYKDLGADKTKSSTLNYLQLPIYAGYRFDLGFLDIILGAGPYFSYGLWGSDDVFDNKLMKRFDAGLAMMAGVEFSRFQITAGYDLGLTNTGKDKLWEGLKSSNIHNRNFKVSVGYFF